MVSVNYYMFRQFTPIHLLIAQCGRTMTGLVSWTCVFLCFNRFPEDGTPVLKHVGVYILNYNISFVFYCILLSE